MNEERTEDHEALLAAGPRSLRGIRRAGPEPEIRKQIERQPKELNSLSAEAKGTLAREQTEAWRGLAKAAGITAE